MCIASLVWLATMMCVAPITTASASTGALAQRPTTAQLATHVKGYFRKDGSYVRPHESRSPGTGLHSYRPPVAPRTPKSYSAPHTYARRAPQSSPPARAPGYAPNQDSRRDERGRFVRSQSAKDEFRRRHPCPCTGSITGPCPGYVIDHISALKRRGADRPENMQWQTVAAAKAKDRWE